MRAKVVGYVEGESMTVRFPFDVRFTNPMGVMQGGMIAAAIDNALGPLSYLVAPRRA
jgi:acyl-coenzyme A thioesterase PaaI-like protein